MKQLAILMALFLAVLLLITGVMAVGNARQSEQITQRAQQLSSTKAELRKAEKENKLLTAQLENSRERVRGLILEQKAVAGKLENLLAMAKGDESSGTATTLPVETAGEALLKAGALEQALFTPGSVQAVMAGQQQVASGTDAAAEEADSAHGQEADGSRICWAAGAEEPDKAHAPAVLAVSDAVVLEVATGDDNAPEGCCSRCACAEAAAEVREPEEAAAATPAERLLEKLRPYVSRLEEAMQGLRDALRELVMQKP